MKWRCCGRGVRLLFFGLWMVVMAGCAQPDAAATTPATAVSPTATLPLGVSLATHAAPTRMVLQTTPTPLPLPTATLTPTPIVVAVEAGNTLLEIALRHGVTVDEILRLNPGIQPEQLQIGQLVQLPPPPTAAASAAAGATVPLRVAVTQLQTGRSAGGYWLLGELVNEGAQPVENVRVTIDWVNDAGEVVRSVAAWATLPVLPMETAVPFGLVLAEPPPDGVQPAVTVSGGAALVTLGSRYLDLTVTETAVSTQDGSDGRVTVQGQVLNSGTQPARDIELAAVFYNAQEKLIGYQKLTLPDVLPPGETTDFTLTAAPPGGQTAHVTLLAQGAVAADDTN